MRTTLDIEEDVLLAAKAIAKREKRSVGQVLSQLAREGLSVAPKLIDGKGRRLGFRPFARRGGVVTDEVVESLRDVAARLPQFGSSRGGDRALSRGDLAPFT